MMSIILCVGPYFDADISVNESDGNVELCVKYLSRDDIPETVNASIGVNNHGKCMYMCGFSCII